MTIINDEFKKNMGKRLCELREKRGLTQIEVEQQVGIKARTISGYENGRNLPKGDNLIYISSRLHIQQLTLRCNDRYV
jgi:transcriptional regulator with XRE-family HTH domain